MRIGEEPEKANLFKIAGNFMIMSAVETMGEAFALLKKGGVDANLFLDTMTEGLFAAPIYKNYGKQILTEAYEPAGFYLWLGLKDSTLVRDAAKELAVPMPAAGSGARAIRRSDEERLEGQGLGLDRAIVAGEGWSLSDGQCVLVETFFPRTQSAS